MHKRHQNTNIPTEIMRSIVEILETGSMTKAARVLGLSQPALTSQIKKIESLVGGSIFTKTSDGSAVTELGKLVIQQARKILEANEQLLQLRGNFADSQTIRLGLSNIYADRLFASQSQADLAHVNIYADNSIEVAKGLLEGYIDVGLFLHRSDVSENSAFQIICERDEELAWVRSEDFMLQPGTPVPLLTWPGQLIDDLMIQSLETRGMIYRIAFASPDHHARLTAARAGIGLTTLPKNMVPLPLIAATDEYLPPLKSARLSLGVRSGFDLETSKLVQKLRECFFGN